MRAIGTTISGPWPQYFASCAGLRMARGGHPMSRSAKIEHESTAGTAATTIPNRNLPAKERQSRRPSSRWPFANAVATNSDRFLAPTFRSSSQMFRSTNSGAKSIERAMHFVVWPMATRDTSSRSLSVKTNVCCRGGAQIWWATEVLRPKTMYGNGFEPRSFGTCVER